MQILRFYFSPFGRVSRKGLWVGFILPYFIIGILMMVILVSLFPSGHGSDPTVVAGFIAERLILLSPILLLIWWASIAIAIKRLHDRNITGFWLLPMFVFGLVGNGTVWFYPELFSGAIQLTFIGLGLVAFLINFWLAINMYFLRGTRGPNRFGPDPLEREA